jgi:hypothetical protein
VVFGISVDELKTVPENFSPELVKPR